MAGKPKGKAPRPSKAVQKKNQEEQSERFIATARELGADESKQAFEHNFRKIVPPQKER